MKYVVIVCLVFLAVVSSSAQQPEGRRISPLAMTTMRFKNTYVKVTYSQPQVKGRQVFGGLVPFGEVWRTGANEATEITLTQDLIVNAQLLKAGTYAIFTIPDRAKWTIIINKGLGLWGAYNYQQKLDVMRFDIPVQAIETEAVEYFTITLDGMNDRGDMVIMWDRTKVVVPIRFAQNP